MLNRSKLEIKNPWWKKSDYKSIEFDYPKRDLYYKILKNLEHTLILNIVGLRRVGKSTILKQIVSKLLNDKVEADNIFYYLFDYSSQIQNSQFLEEVLHFYFKEIINRPILDFTENEKVYILLDEIQYIDNWQSILKRYYDLSNKRIKFIITGSQSLLLKGKYKESLAGRIFDYYLSPLSFREFLRINREKVELLKPYDLFQLPSIFGEISQFELYNGRQTEKLAREYITTGQFPEIRKFDLVELRHEYIAESVIGKIQEDCIRLFKIEKPNEFKLITKHLLNNVSSIFELSNISREIEVSKKTLDRYFNYLKESYVFEVLYKYHKSLIKRGRILKKLYTPCINFTCALNQYNEEHIDQVPQAFGKIVENIVYNVLKLKYETRAIGDQISFWRDKQKELDFIVLNKGEKLAIEVKFSNNVNIKDLFTLVDYVKNKKLKYGIVISKNNLEKKEINGQTLYLIPYYLFLLLV